MDLDAINLAVAEALEAGASCACGVMMPVAITESTPKAMSMSLNTVIGVLLPRCRMSPGL